MTVEKARDEILKLLKDGSLAPEKLYQQCTLGWAFTKRAIWGLLADGEIKASNNKYELAKPKAAKSKKKKSS